MSSSNRKEVWELIKSIQKIDYVRPEDIPNIDLYMDQVTTFMDQHLASAKRFEDDKTLTKTMINNYTKNNLLPPPERKKYSKEHMFLLIFIYYFKNFLSINDIQSILNPLTEHFFDQKEGISMEEVYREVFELQLENIDDLVKDVVKKWKKSNLTFEDSDTKSTEEKDFLTTFSFICMLSFDVWVKKNIIENIIDGSIHANTSAEKKAGKTEKPEKASKKSEKAEKAK